MYSRIIHSMEVIETQPEIDYVKIGQRIRAARLEKGYSQADLGALVGIYECSHGDGEPKASG